MSLVNLWGEVVEETRICSECKQEKTLESFSMDTTYVRSKCKSCKTKHNNVLRDLKKHHPKPSKDYECPICGDTQEDMVAKGYVRTSWCLDHDHESNKFRGYICHLCNTGISNLQEDIGILRNAVRYLESSILDLPSGE